MTETRACPICGKAVPPSKTRPRIFCAPRHRQAAYDLEQRALQMAERAAVAQKQAEEALARTRSHRGRKEAT